MEEHKNKKIISLFSGTGGLDRGFENEGYKIAWANEYDKDIWETYEANFPKTKLSKESIVKIDPAEIPFRPEGIIGGPPCQSWSEAGSHRGINDDRGKLFFDYIKFIREKRPKFFLAENVAGLLFSRHSDALDNIFDNFLELGYNVSFSLLNANDYGVPQDRKRVIIVGYPVSYDEHFEPPKPDEKEDRKTLKDSIWDLRKGARPALEKNRANKKLKTPNHEYMIGNFSSMYMSRNRVRSWEEPSFTIQAGGRHAPCHPQAPKFQKVHKDLWKYDPSVEENKYRRLSVRECARIQTFPDDHIFHYKNVPDGYKMIGNAVAVDFAARIAKKIRLDMKRLSNMPIEFNKKGTLQKNI